MDKKQALVASLSLAIAVTALVYVLRPPAPIYYPIAHAWDWQKRSGEPGMSWYGRSAWSLGAGLASYALARVVLARVSVREGVARALGSAALVVLVLVLGSVAWHEYVDWMR